MRRSMILAIAVAAFFLVPVAQSTASSTVKVKVNGTGSGKVREVTLYTVSEPAPIDCPGTCTGTMPEGFVVLGAFDNAGSEFTDWTVTKGIELYCERPSDMRTQTQEIRDEFPEYAGMDGVCVIEATDGEAEITATFKALPSTLKVNIVGFSGKVKEITLYTSSEPAPIDCPGVCEGTMPEEVAALGAFPDEGNFVFLGWTITKGSVVMSCDGSKEERETAKAIGKEFSEYAGMDGFCVVEAVGGEAEVTATFNHFDPGNRRTLTLTKSPDPSTGKGTGTVSSKPKGINCGAACEEATALLYKDSSIELTAKPSTGSAFKEWKGACTGSSPTCTAKMTEDEEVEAVFSGTSKAFSPAEELTVEKAGTGKGAVKAYGSLACEAECTSTRVLYQGPITEPKPRAGKTVILKQYPAFGSEFGGWTGCDSVTEAGECVVAMSTDKTVSAEYTALPNKVLTINKSYAKGNGSVASKPRGIKCAATCTQAVAAMPQDAAVELVAKPMTGTFVKWEGGDCNGSTSITCTVTMDANETIKAVFSDPGKAFLGGSEKTLTLNKAGSGLGTVKASGLACEALCSSTSILYQGPITLPKAKPGKTVVLKAASAPGSKAVQWTGCDSVTEAGECVVTMETDKTVTATFDEVE